MIKKLKAEKQNTEQLPPPVPDPPGGDLPSDAASLDPVGSAEPEVPEMPVDPLQSFLQELRDLPENERVLALVAKVWESQPALSFGQLIDHIFLCRPAGMGPLMAFLSTEDFILILERVLTTPPVSAVRPSVKPTLPRRHPVTEVNDPDVADRFAATTGRMPMAQF